jgi:N-methylhydantoinase A
VIDADRFTVGIDIGGTFTDCAVIEEKSGSITVAKALSTPKKPSDGFFAALEAAAEELGLTLSSLLTRTSRIVHGTTRGTNAIVARHGAKVGLITTIGHRDVTHIMKGGARTRGIPPDRVLHLPSTGKPEAIVPKDLIVEVVERIDRDGEVVVPLQKEALLAAVHALRRQGIESIAVSFLWSIRNPVHERLARTWIEEAAPEVFISCAHELAATVGEFSRTMTAVMNSYIGPLMVRYVADIEAGARERGFSGRILFTQCAGGAITGDEARAAPIQTLQSGPVSGIMASHFLADRLSMPNVITADMGGTTLDVGIVAAGLAASRPRSLFERFELSLPMLDVESIGAGGGSIAYIDESGRLQVGPKSAGAQPGPVCFGLGGTEPTVTDADVVLGVINPKGFLGGKMQLDVDAAERAIAALGDKLGLGVYETAAGINRLVDSRMGDLIRRMSLLRGLDPRNFVCYAFGGGGPPHAGAMAREAGVKTILVPLLNAASVWSAFGGAACDIVHVLQSPKRMKLPVDRHELRQAFDELAARARAIRARHDLTESLMQFQLSVRMKYMAQVHDVEVLLPDESLTGDINSTLEARFSETYSRRFGRGAGFASGGTEIMSLQLRCISPVAKPALPEITIGNAAPQWTKRKVYWDEMKSLVDTPVLEVGDLKPDGRFEGPVLVDLPNSVIVVRPGQAGYFDSRGSFAIDEMDGGTRKA